MKTLPKFSYCAHEVYAHDRDRFLLSLFIPAAHRELLLVLYALNVELAKIRGLISEEMIGHIRHAWWREGVEGLYAGTAPRGQPVLEALVPIIAAGYMPQATLMRLPESYCDHFPGAPPGLAETMETLSLTLIRALSPDAEEPWRKAQHIIKKHRLRHGRRRNSWLNLKLLVAGL